MNNKKPIRPKCYIEDNKKTGHRTTKNKPIPNNATLSQARKSKALLGLRYPLAGGNPPVHPRFHPGPGSPQLIGLTSRITEKSPQVARVSHAPVAPFTLNPLRRTPCHQIERCHPQATPHSWQPGHPPRSTVILCPQGAAQAGPRPGVRHLVTD